MINTRFERYKLDRTLKRDGKAYEFYRNAFDKYGDKTHIVHVVTLDAIYHETTLPNNYMIQVVDDATQVRHKKYTLLLCRWQEAETIKDGDIVFIGGDTYTVTGKNNIQQLGIYCDISVEKVIET
ncbi:MAG: hypothetical protein MJ168_08075 [Clostridia bacterium]|nr:hypothetical protein [Clostridia bacterium]